ncbi:class I SAM-dependent methyltransferase [Candidatus Woesearchaeota archaeon]|nr:class I SAM-dependent methyltransferase [Candidatus Woesearchaeota archaeon]
MLWSFATGFADNCQKMADSRPFYDRIWASQEAAKKEERMLFLRQQAIEHSYSLLGDLRNKTLLEIGSGSGKQAVFFAKQGAKVSVVDISSESLKAVLRMAEKQDVAVQSYQMNAEKMGFEDETFDRVYINSVLMHVEQEKVLQECSRVLKPGGKVIIVEPLRYAPFVQIYRFLSSYRKMCPHYATPKMFTKNSLFFTTFSHEEFYSLSSALLPMGYSTIPLLKKMYTLTSKADRALLKRIPFLKKLCWISVVCYTKL